MATTLLSPQVFVQEVDNSGYTTAQSISGGAGVISASWGPVLDPQIIDNENTLVNVFGQPNDQNFKNWLSVANFLAYTSNCYVTRIATENQFNANAAGKTGFEYQQFENSSGEMVTVVDENGDPVKSRVGVVINNDSDFSSQFDDPTDTYGQFAARYPGELGNSILVTYADSDSFANWQWTDDAGTTYDWTSQFSNAPGTSNWAAARNGSNDELHILVVDAGGQITGSKGTILEKYEFVSKSSDARDLDGVSNNYRKVINDQSEYVYCLDYPSDDQLVVDYNRKVRVIGNSLAVEAVTDVARGDFAINTETQMVMVGQRQTEISDEGVQRVVVRFVDYAKLSDWVGSSVYDISTSAVYHVVQKQDTVECEVDNTQGVNNWGTSVIDKHFASLVSPASYRLSGGADDFDYSDSDEIACWDVLANKERYQFGICITGAATPTVAKYVVENVCETRMDCVAFISPTTGDRGPFLGAITEDDRMNGVTSSELKILNQTLQYRTQSSFNVNSSYGHLDSGWKYQYDKYNDCNRWVPLNGDCAGLYAQADSTTNEWTPAAGYNRGQIKNVIKLNYSPNKAHRDQLYPQQINPVVTFAGEGTILYGTKSLQTKPSALDRLHVRRLLIYIERTLEQTLKYVLFELNNATNRAYVVNLIDPVLRNIAGQGGLYAYKVQCDTTNNTADIIDQNMMVVDVFLSPSKSTDFIILRLNVERTGSSTFTETV